MTNQIGVQSGMKISSAVPVIATADVLATVDFYTTMLGFNQHFVFGDPPVYAGVERDGVLLYITLDAAFAAAIKTQGVHLTCFCGCKMSTLCMQNTNGGARILERGSDNSPVGCATVCD